MVRSSPRKAKQEAIRAEPPVKATTNGASAKKASAVKRKASPEPEEWCDSHAEEEEGEEKKPAKKRKTKAADKGTTMPHAARTAVSSLKRAMYIGAHVSAAGGQTIQPLTSYANPLTLRQEYTTPSTTP